MEVTLPLDGIQRLSLDALALGLLFAECSIVMILVQGGLFATNALERSARGWAAAGAFLAMAAGLILIMQGRSFLTTAVAVGIVALGSAYLLPALTYLASVESAGREGASLGAMTAAGSLGQALGSAAGGSLYALIAEAALWYVGASMLLAAWYTWVHAPHPCGQQHNAPSTRSM
jgi:predicted MFS family arabinose efflux permease